VARHRHYQWHSDALYKLIIENKLGKQRKVEPEMETEQKKNVKRKTKKKIKKENEKENAGGKGRENENQKTPNVKIKQTKIPWKQKK
jgi:hypothetical protein